MPGPLKLVIEGWRSLSHSYAIVNQWQLLALARRRNLDLRVSDRPYALPAWRPQPDLFPPQCEGILHALPSAPPGFMPDATWRTAFPLDLASAASGRTLVFGTAEYQIIPPSSFAPGAAIASALADPRVAITTPSAWSAEGFRKLGFPGERIAVIPHGVDPQLFRPRPRERAAIRRQFGLSGFVFMNAGAMTANKGIDVLLTAFAAVAEQRADVVLLLKGADSLYASRQYLRRALDSMPRTQAARVADRLVYLGDALSMAQMARLYQASDAYVSPYRAEGFNLPVLEAVASGLPVICTRGGPTDEVADESFALGIESQTRTIEIEGQDGAALEPDLDHLIALMLRVIDDPPFRAAAARAGPRHVAEAFTWDRAVARTLAFIGAWPG